MATFDKTRDGKNNEKKGVCVLAAEIDFSEQNVAVGESVLLANLPEKAVITNAFFLVKTAPTGGTQTLKLDVGATTSVAAIALGTSDGAFKGVTTKAHTGVGAEAVVTAGVADLVDGIVEVVVEYVEYTKTTGELTTI